MNLTLISPVAVVFLLLLTLPVRLATRHLKILALLIWLSGGGIMAWRGLSYLLGSGASTVVITIAVIASVVVGAAKGWFILSRTSKRNITRLEAMTERQRPIRVYSPRSWIFIAMMVGIGVSMTLLGAPPLVRGVILLGVGMALVLSSVAYVRSLQSAMTQ